MRRIIAAIDDTAAARAVLAAGRSIADLFDGGLEAVHVRDDGARMARAAATTAGLKLREVTGSVVDVLISEAQEPGVAALVLGSRATPGGRRPAGHIALEVISAAKRPVAVVPPDVEFRHPFKRLLVPLDGTVPTAKALGTVIELACGRGVDVVVLHVLDEDSLPSFSDQPHYEAEAWVREFMTRYCPAAGARAELRVGVPAPAVISVAKETGADLVALSWSQELASGRAAVVREVLERGRSAVLLVPVDPSELHVTLIPEAGPVAAPSSPRST